MASPAELFERWAPAESPWSDWAKPILFATMPKDNLDDSPPPVPAPEAVAWIRDLDGSTAVVVDLPGDEAVAFGAALATRGLRPVPLFNGTDGPRPTVDVGPVRRALARYAFSAALAALPSDAPPAFLLDSRRMGGRRGPAPGDFDNRWMVFPQDFPSARRLLAAGIARVLLIAEGAKPPDDLAHVLRRWHEAGLRLRIANVAVRGEARDLDVPRPTGFGSLWYRTLVLLGLRRSSAGGFGALVPVPGQGGGYG